MKTKVKIALLAVLISSAGVSYADGSGWKVKGVAAKNSWNFKPTDAQLYRGTDGVTVDYSMTGMSLAFIGSGSMFAEFKYLTADGGSHLKPAIGEVKSPLFGRDEFSLNFGSATGNGFVYYGFTKTATKLNFGGQTDDYGNPVRDSFDLLGVYLGYGVNFHPVTDQGTLNLSGSVGLINPVLRFWNGTTDYKKEDANLGVGYTLGASYSYALSPDVVAQIEYKKQSYSWKFESVPYSGGNVLDRKFKENQSVLGFSLSVSF